MGKPLPVHGPYQGRPMCNHIHWKNPEEKRVLELQRTETWDPTIDLETSHYAHVKNGYERVSCDPASAGACEAME